MTFDPMQNRIQTRNLMADELAALKAAKHGWQYQSSEIGGKSYWRDMDCTPEWHCGTVYRAKPAPAPTITCNGVTVPEPEREALPYGAHYWVPHLLADGMRMEMVWRDDHHDRLWLSCGLVHRSSAAAIVHAQAMIKGAV